ncbi:MAG: thiol reductant ABC exporter subunit CydD [Moraxella sp.]|nr:thiol reductant ABC exporter subunit CydD [Moraxella sp.]
MSHATSTTPLNSSGTDEPNTSQKHLAKRRKKSDEQQKISAFLKTALTPVKHHIYTAWLLDVVSVLILIVQMLALSAFFAALLTAQFEGVLTKTVATAALIDALPILAGCFFVRPIVGFVRDKIITKAGLIVAKNQRAAALAGLEQLALERDILGADGAIASYVIDEPDALMGFARFNAQKYTAVTTPLIIAMAAAFKSVTAALVLLATAPLVPIFMAIIGIATAKKSRAQMDALAQLGGRFLDWIRGMNTLVRLSAVEVAEQDLQVSANEYKQRTMSVLKIAFLNSAVLEWFSALSIALVAVYLGFGLMGILPWAKGEVVTNYQAALFILLLVPEFYAPLRRLGAEYHAKGAAESAAKMLIKFERAPNFKQNKYQALPLLVAPSLSFDNISVTQNGRVRLSPISFDVACAQKVAIVGCSGAGKTTLLSILLGFTAYQGSIAVGADDKVGEMIGFDALDKDLWRQQVGYLSQTATLLPMSIGDNLRLAKPSASEMELMTVLRQVGLGELLAHLPKGLQTPLGEQGSGLSGGQASRLAIAQLLLQEAPLWLLDEPTEHLDAQTKAEIHALLVNVSQDKTVLWVTHDSAWQASGYFDKLISLVVEHDNEN